MKPAHQKLHDEHRAMDAAILDVTKQWAHLENILAIMLGQIVNRGLIGTAIYYTPGNAETRFDIVDNAFSAFLEMHEKKMKELGSPEASQILAAEWDSVFKGLNRSRKARNEIVHGNVINHHQLGKVTVRLTAPIFDAVRRRKEAPFPQLPGKGARDVYGVAEKMGALNARINHLTQAVQALNAGDAATLQRIIRALADYPQSTGGRQSGGLTPQE